MSAAVVLFPFERKIRNSVHSVHSVQTFEIYWYWKPLPLDAERGRPSACVQSHLILTVLRLMWTLKLNGGADALCSSPVSIMIERRRQPCMGASMSSSSDSLTSSAFERSTFEPRVPPGRLDPVFREVFRSYGAAARHFNVAEMTIWRWCHDRSPPPHRVMDALVSLIHKKVESSHFAQDELRRFMALPSRSPRKPSGCCAPDYKRP
jgi:hypothetical protein